MTTWRNQNDAFMQIRKRDLIDLKNLKIILESPRLLGFYSYFYEVFEPSNYIKYFKEPKLSRYPLDLNMGYSKARCCVTGTYDSRLNVPLRYAIGNIDGLKSNGISAINVYTSRRVLFSLMEWCYGKYDFHVLVTRFNGSLYMAGEPAAGLEKPQQLHHKQLEQYLFADSPDNEPNTEEPIDMNIALSALHRANVGKFSLIYAGEVQGIISDKKLENLTDMDLLNQCRFVFTKQMWDTAKKEHYFLRYWIQSRLSNIEDLYVAYKNTHGIVEKPIEHHNVSDIPKLFSWKPEVCYGFLHKFLENVENLMRDVNSLDTVYEFKFNAKNKTTTYEVYKGREDKMFIPKYYADFVSK
ncbi:decapping and exoribonuclease protein Rai1-like isoform X2 [Musca autumnalis]|uniref:decapping and exoribonuclease protein Rai1-like isoform X2 n=1 Tax=Musca autumnalis TaxID=221902 RepID=UPI003CF24956